MKVLLVDDDEDFLSGLSMFLYKHDIESVLTNRTAEAEQLLKKTDFDAILLDVMLPGCNGFEFLPTIRKTSDVPVIMLTALNEEEEMINGLDLGADDYITKPFSPKELVARLRALHRRHNVDKVQIKISHEDIELFPNELLVRVGEAQVKLTSVESQLLQLLVTSSNNYVSRDVLYYRVLKREMTPFDRSLDVHMSNLRKKLGPHPSKGARIKAIRGLGYRLIK